MALLGATGHTYAVALILQAQSIVPATAEMYAVCASRCVSQQIVPVAPCDSARGFVFAEGSATNSVHSIHYHRCLQIMLWHIRNSTYNCLFSQDFNQIGLCSCSTRCSIFIEK